MGVVGGMWRVGRIVGWGGCHRTMNQCHELECVTLDYSRCLLTCIYQHTQFEVRHLGQ